MTDKNAQNKKEPININNINNDLIVLVEKKIEFFKDVIQKTIIHVQKNKFYDILGMNDLSICIERLGELSEKIIEIKDVKNTTQEVLINGLQLINNELSGLLKNYGTDSLEDLISICFGSNNKFVTDDKDKDKFELLKKYFHPTSYKIITKKDDKLYDDKTPNISCYDITGSYKQFHMKVYGIKLYIRSEILKKSLIIFGYVDDVVIKYLHNNFILKKNKDILNNLPNESEFKLETFNTFMCSLILKDYLIYESNTDYYNKFIGNITNINNIKQQQITQVVKEFITDDMYNKRNTLINLLIKSSNCENQYLAYLLYDLLSNDSNGNVDTLEQTILFDSFPWPIKQFFKQAMKKTVQYTNELSNFDINKIPLEQQICLLKVTDVVKEKAMTKLKEVKAKSEDSGSKARQYLDGLLKIPFGIYKSEPILNVMENIKTQFKNIFLKYNVDNLFPSITFKEKYSSIEIFKYIKTILNQTSLNDSNDKLNKILTHLISGDKPKIINNITSINKILQICNKKYEKKYEKIKVNSLNKDQLKKEIEKFIELCKNGDNDDLLKETLENYIVLCSGNNLKNFDAINDVKEINKNFTKIQDYMGEVKSTLDKAVHGHDKAKKQIERIIGQWINGEQDGYCFGFEGPPGVGKCFAKNTQIMLFNGKIKKVQDVTINDKLMGDDSTPRNILALGSGREKMYKIQQAKGDEYIVNESHILSLKLSGISNNNYKTIMGRRYYKNDIIDICIKDYLGLPEYVRNYLMGYKVGLNFSETNVDIDPFILGYWLGSNNFSEKFEEANIIDSLEKYGLLRAGIVSTKFIPDEYKCNSQNVRIKLLAGIIDSVNINKNKNKSKNKNIKIMGINKSLVDDILWLIRSLGLRGTVVTNVLVSKACKKTYNIIIKNIFFKEAHDELVTKIKVIELDEDVYYGFQIDGNSRFLLGDFTVTHNTSLAKRGLSNCLKDDKGVSRPFSMIQMGGDSNGSTLHGHNYTYVGSMWGSIVQILIDKKCMNPIIFIDEVDKISRTEHGKEMVGILTHLLDPAQNDCFQDKYFTGIDLDLSKALFILSYNDVEAIDKILMDRVHRIKFNNLSLEDKLVICNTHILPDVYKKMGLEDIIYFSDDVLKIIIEEYTSESGVRKLKEILFEVVGEINLAILKNDYKDFEIPLKITIDDIKNKYFKDKRETLIRKVPETSIVGYANGMYATSLGTGGTLPIQAKFFPSEQFLELKLTGLQQDVMRESMHVSLTVAWNLTTEERKKEIRKMYDGKFNKYGINIHPGDGSIQKDGPSAGGIITIVLYSLLNNIPIKAKTAMTGEIQMSGDITAIGGLNYKILGSIKSGVTKFIYPNENKKDFDEFYEKYKNDNKLNNIEFFGVDNVKEALELILDK